MGWQDAPVVETAQPKWMSAPEVAAPAEPSMGAVALNAAAKGAAGVPDMFLNAPANAANLAQGAYAYGMEKAGHPEAWADLHLFKQPNLARHLMEKVGLIQAQNEPHTVGQRLVDTAVQGGVGMLANPASGLAGVAKNIGTGILGGTAAQTAKEATGSDLAGVLAGAAVPFAVRAGISGTVPSSNAVKDATLKAGQKAGYVIPPSEVNPSFLNNRLESIAGKAAIKQESVMRNQAVTNKLAAEDLGLPKETPITESVLRDVRDTASAPYKAIAALSPRAASALERLKEARFEANDTWKFYQRTGDPKVRKEAEALSQKSDIYEKVIERQATALGQPDLVAQLKEGRKMIAKTYDVEKAMNLGSADISAPTIGSQLDKAGLAAKSGNLSLIGQYQQAFPKFMGEGQKSPTPGVSAVEPLTGLGLGMGGAAMAGPAGWLAAGIPLVRGPVRSALLSNRYQRFATTPGLGHEPLGSTAVKSALLARAIAERNKE